MKLSTLSIILGLVLALVNSFGVLKPSAFGAVARKFPRSLPIGYVLTLLGTAWFVWNVSQESLSDFESIKSYLFALFIAVGIGACLFVKDFLAVRGLAVVVLLLAKWMVDTARWADSQWRLVIVTWAYMMAMAGMWLTVSPWRLRDLINWANANEKRTRLFSCIRLAFGLLVAYLGFAVFAQAGQ